MKVRVLVLTERLDGLARTMRDLDAQAFPYADFGVTFVARGLGRNESAKLEELESRRPNVTVSTVPAGGDWSQAITSSMDAGAADHVLAMPLGAGLLPEALPRLVALAETGRAVVVARQIGRPAWERRRWHRPRGRAAGGQRSGCVRSPSERCRYRPRLARGLARRGARRDDRRRRAR